MTVIADEQMCPCGSMRSWGECCKGRVNPEFFDQIEVPTGAGPGSLDRLMKQGYEEFEEHNYAEAVKPWWKLWANLIQYNGMESKSIRDWDNVLLLGEFLGNWCYDFGQALHNAGVDDPTYFEKRIQFCDEFIERFPKSEPLTRENMRRDAAETCFYLGNIDEGERRFNKLAEDFPDSQWVYIGWGDMYSPAMVPKDVSEIDRSRELYEKALDVTDDRDEDEIKGRLSKLPAIE